MSYRTASCNCEIVRGCVVGVNRDDKPKSRQRHIRDLYAGYHMQCLPIESRPVCVPEGDWHCPDCQEQGIWQAEEVRGKTTKRRHGRSLVHYLVHWKGYPDEDDSWEPLSNLSSAGAKKLVAAFQKAHRVQM